MELTVPEAARRAGRSPETIRRWIWRGRLPARKVGNQHLIDAETLDLLVAPDRPEEAEVPRLPGARGEWLARADMLGRRLRGRGVRLPPADELVRASRSGR
jgi:excisionase family DNA binding protein